MYALLNNGLVVETTLSVSVNENIVGNRYDLLGNPVEISGKVIEILDWVYPAALVQL